MTTPSGGLDVTTQWSNLLGMMDWVNAHPLPDDASHDSDVYQARQLLLAAIVAAERKLQSGTGGSADPSYQQALTLYKAYAAGRYLKEMPSPLAMKLANIGLDVGKPVVQIAMAVGLILLIVFIAPRLLALARRA